MNEQTLPDKAGSNAVFGPLDPSRMLDYGQIRYVAGWPESYVREYAAAAVAAERERHVREVHSCHKNCAIAGCVNVRLREALTHLRDRIKDHPAYEDLTEDEEIEKGGDTAELSYLARVADYALRA